MKNKSELCSFCKYELPKHHPQCHADFEIDAEKAKLRADKKLVLDKLKLRSPKSVVVPPKGESDV